MNTSEIPRAPLPRFNEETAVKKVRGAEDAWNTRDPDKVSLAYTAGSVWRNRSEFIIGRAAIVEFLAAKWARELEYRLIKELWAFHENRIAVRFAYDWHNSACEWFRSYGNENLEFDTSGLMRRRIASINDLPIKESERRYRWQQGRRPEEHPSLSDFGKQLRGDLMDKVPMHVARSCAASFVWPRRDGQCPYNAITRCAGDRAPLNLIIKAPHGRLRSSFRTAR